MFPWVCAFALLASVAQPVGLQESMALRKIAEYWKEGDAPSVKAHISDYLKKYPESGYTDHLYAMLGDLCLQESKGAEALAAYEKIKGPHFTEKTRLNRLHALFDTGNYPEVIARAPQYLKQGGWRSEGEQDTARFLLAESLFRQALVEGNDKEALLKEALPHLKSLLQSKYKEQCILPLAETYKALKDYPSAASFYSALAEKYPEKKEELLFQVANLQAHFNPKEACESYRKVYECDGRRGAEAAFNHLALLFQQKQYGELLQVQEKAMKYIPREKSAQVHYFIGKSLIGVFDFAAAVKHFDLVCRSDGVTPDELHMALLSLLHCAQKTKDRELFSHTLQALKNSFPTDSQIPNAQLVYAALCREQKEYKLAQEELRILLDKGLEGIEREPLLFDYASTLAEAEQWDGGEEAFALYLKQYPDGKFATSAWRHLLNCAQHRYARSSAETAQMNKEHLAFRLTQLLDQGQVLSATERREARLLYVQLEYELGNYDEALQAGQDYLRDYSKELSCADVHLLMALSHQKTSFDWLLFTVHAEKALLLNPNLKDKEALHLQLYNAYLQLAQQQKEKGVMLMNAAEHLYQALDKALSVQQGNIEWLADHYFQRAKKEKGESLERSLLLYQRLAKGVDGKEFEAHTLRIAELYGLGGKQVDRLSVLEQLSSRQQKEPKKGWKALRQVGYELAQTYQALGQHQKALEQLTTLIEIAPRATSYYTAAAHLARARLKYALGNAPIPEILDELKELQIQKQLATEPIHIEAALEYVRIKSNLRDDLALPLLETIVADFSSLEDPLVRSYLAARSEFPEKEQLVQAYLKFVEAEILRLKATTAAMRIQALEMLQMLVDHSESMPQQLTERARLSMEALKRTL